MNAVLLGATRGMGRALARLMAERKDRLFLLGRDADELQRSAHDLEALGAAGEVGFAQCDLGRADGFAAALDRAQEALGRLETIVVTAAQFASQEELENDAALRDRLLTVNFTNTIHFCEEARRRLLDGGGGTLCVFSSGAGDRARKPVLLYGATKAGLSHYLNGLDHKFRRSGLKTVLIKPGFVRTSMTAGLPEPPFTGEPEQVARIALRALDRGKPVTYAPKIWRWVMFCVRLLPRAVMRRAKF